MGRPIPMSRTDVHRPWPMQAQDWFNRHRLKRGPRYWGDWQDLRPLYISCGCPICTNRWGRHQDIRTSRVQWRRTATDILKTVREDREYIDPVTRRRAHWPWS